MGSITFLFAWKKKCLFVCTGERKTVTKKDVSRFLLHIKTNHSAAYTHIDENHWSDRIAQSLCMEFKLCKRNESPYGQQWNKKKKNAKQKRSHFNISIKRNVSSEHANKPYPFLRFYLNLYFVSFNGEESSKKDTAVSTVEFIHLSLTIELARCSSIELLISFNFAKQVDCNFDFSNNHRIHLIKLLKSSIQFD